MKVLNVAEKPSVAKSLAALLGRGQSRRREGRSQYNKVFECDGIQVPSLNGQVTMVITSVSGHLMEMDFADSHRSWSSCEPAELFEAPVRVFIPSGRENSREKLAQTLKEEARGCDALVLWLDCDREGENIAFEVVKVVKEAKPSMRVLRATFSAVTPGEVHRALRTLQPPNELKSKAVDARRELDLRVGAAFTRFQTMLLRDKFKFDDDQEARVISYGPCQFPTLGFVVARDDFIESFVPEAFWKIVLKDRRPAQPVVDGAGAGAKGGTAKGGKGKDANQTVTFTWARGRLYDRLACFVLFELVASAGQATVQECIERPRYRYPPKPLDTVTMQQRISRAHRLGSERTMKIAEDLYNKGIISYPRTETQIFKSDFPFAKILGELASSSTDWGTYAARLKDEPGFFSMPAPGGKDDEAHPPIHPTKAVDPSALQQDERNVYTYVVRHFLAACSRCAVAVVAYMGGERFTAKGLIVLERNYLEIYPYDRWETNTIPNYEPGTSFTPHSLTMEDGMTQPPSLLTEEELIGLMNSNGIGTDATIADHIKTIQERRYATKHQGRFFKPTKLGTALVRGYARMGYELDKPTVRAETERLCDDIVRGARTQQDVLRHVLARMRDIFTRVVSSQSVLESAVAESHERAAPGAGGGFGLEAKLAQSRCLRRTFTRCGKCGGDLALHTLPSRGGRGGEGGRGRGRGRGRGGGTGDGGGGGGRSSDATYLLRCNPCDVTVQLPRSGGMPTAVGTQCAICGFGAVTIPKGERGYNVCPWCWRNPPQEYNEAGERTMPCFKCTHPTCPLSTRANGGRSKVVLGPCPHCDSGDVTLSRFRSRGGKDMAIVDCSRSKGGCSRSRAVFWEALAIEEAAAGGTCARCSHGRGEMKRARLKLKPASIPAGCPSQFEECALCDGGGMFQGIGWATFRA